MSRNRSSRLSALAACEDRFGPDTAETVFTFDDGWTITRLRTLEELKRDGTLMHNCMAKDFCAVGTAGSLVEEEWILTLRDTDRFPRVMFLHRPMSGTRWDGLSFSDEGRDRSPTKPAYRARISRWHQTLPYPAAWLDEVLSASLHAAAEHFVSSLWWLEDLRAMGPGVFAHDGRARALPPLLAELRGRIVELLTPPESTPQTDLDAPPPAWVVPLLTGVGGGPEDAAGSSV